MDRPTDRQRESADSTETFHRVQDGDDSVKNSVIGGGGVFSRSSLSKDSTPIQTAGWWDNRTTLIISYVMWASSNEQIRHGGLLGQVSVVVRQSTEPPNAHI